MNKNFYIIGSGFSAAITKIYLGKFARIIGLHSPEFLKNNNKLIRRKEIECNKFFGKKSYSYGTLSFDLKESLLHDRLILNGNSGVWGGIIDLSNLDSKDLILLKNKNIHFKKISFEETGTISSNKNIFQIQNNKKKIYKISNTSIEIEDGYLDSFLSKNKQIFVKIKFKKKLEEKIIKVDKLFLCTGTVQLLDLLFRSNFIKNGDKIELSEFYHQFKFKLINSNFENNATTVRYHCSRALGHYLGIQFYSMFLKIFKYVPLYIDQVFFNKKEKLKLMIEKDTVVEKKIKKTKYKFGRSIHYCNLKINNMNINKFLHKINPNIYGVGMSFVNQAKPGPISNEIILDAKYKCHKIMKKKISKSKL